MDQLKAKTELTLPAFSLSAELSERAVGQHPIKIRSADILSWLSDRQGTGDQWHSAKRWFNLASNIGSWTDFAEELIVYGGEIGRRTRSETIRAKAARVSQDFGSATSKSVQLLTRAVTHDTESLWQNLQASIEEDGDLEPVRRQFDEFLQRHAENGVRALSAVVLGRLPSGEVAWSLLRMIGEAMHPETSNARRDLLAAAIESRDAGLRYAAASALGEIGDEPSRRALQRRLLWEKNQSVQRMIKAELRG
jgi:hypothetical protein